MTPEKRKSRTETLLKQEGIPFLPSLPCIESEAETHLRSPEEVGIRIACLFCVVGYAFEPGDMACKEYLREYKLWDHLTSDELSFLSNDSLDPKSIINFTWRSEAMFVLMWATCLFDVLPMPREETDNSLIVSKFPSFDQSPWLFIKELRLRDKSIILDASDLIYRLHWSVRQAEMENKQPPADLDPGLIQEWHHAINWITRYEDQEWDEVNTDT